MPEADTGADRGDDLRAAVKRLMEFRDAALRDPRDLIMRSEGTRRLNDRPVPEFVRLCLDDTVWHAVEEALKKTPSV